MCVCVRTRACLSLEFTMHRDFEMGVEGSIICPTYSSVLCMLDHLIRFMLLPATVSGENIISYKYLK